MTAVTTTTLMLPALRAHMGDWVYYIAFLKLRDVAERISVAEDIHTSQSLRDLLQRGLTDRSSGIADYLVHQPQRFFNALVVATYGGNPEWNELSIRESPLGLSAPPPHIEGALGILTLQGSERLFAVDGQHRVKGIKQAIDQNQSLGDEEVCTIFVKGVTQERRADNPSGFERTRRLFTTLNRYAKPVSKRDIIALDEDDVSAIVTRRLVEEYEMFRDKISLNLTKNIPVSDKRSITTITTIYDAIDIYFKTPRGWTDYKKLRPSDTDIDRFYDKAVELFDLFRSHFPPFEEIAKSDPDHEVAGRYRGNWGGHLLFRPVGLLIVVRVVTQHVSSGLSLTDAVKSISKIPTDLAGEPWAGLLWDSGNRRMLTAPENQKVAERLLFYKTGGNLTRFRGYNSQKLKDELAGILNIPVTEISLEPLA